MTTTTLSKRMCQYPGCGKPTNRNHMAEYCWEHQKRSEKEKYILRQKVKNPHIMYCHDCGDRIRKGMDSKVERKGKTVEICHTCAEKD